MENITSLFDAASFILRFQVTSSDINKSILAGIVSVCCLSPEKRNADELAVDTAFGLRSTYETLAPVISEYKEEIKAGMKDWYDKSITDSVVLEAKEKMHIGFKAMPIPLEDEYEDILAGMMFAIEEIYIGNIDAKTTMDKFACAYALNAHLNSDEINVKDTAEDIMKLLIDEKLKSLLRMLLLTMNILRG